MNKRTDDLPWLAKLKIIQTKISKVRGEIQYKHNKMWGKSFCGRLKLLYDICKLEKVKRQLLRKQKDHIRSLKSRSRKTNKIKLYFEVFIEFVFNGKKYGKRS